MSSKQSINLLPFESKWFPSSNRNDLKLEHFVGKNNISESEFHALFDQCACLTVKLYGMQQTTSNSVLKEALEMALFDHAETNNLRGVDSAQISVFSPNNWAGTRKPCTLGIIVPGDQTASTGLFQFLYKYIDEGGLCIPPSNRWSIHNKTPTPCPPISAMMKTAVRSFLDAKPSKTPPSLAGTIATTTAARTLHGLHISGIASTPVPSVVGTNELYRESFGTLRDGLQSPVIEPVRLIGFVEKISVKFKDLVLLIGSHIHEVQELTSISSRGTTFFAERSNLQIGKPGAEGLVYIGLFFGRDQHVTKDNLAAKAQSGTRVAVKRYHHGVISKECEVTKSIDKNSRGIIAYLDDVQTELHQAYVQELGMVDLLEYYKTTYSATNCPIDDTEMHQQLMRERLRIVRGLCLAVQELHRKKIVHRDLRMPNVLLMESGCLKICDFGLSRNVVEEQQIRSTYKDKAYNGQPYEVLIAIKKARLSPLNNNHPKSVFQRSTSLAMTAPALGEQLLPDFELQGQQYLVGTYSVDIFMLGCLIAQVVQGTHPFPHNELIEGKEEPDLYFYDYFPGGALLTDLLKRMLSHDSESRPSIEEVLVHPYFQSWAGRRAMFDQLDSVLHHEEAPVYDAEFQAMEVLLAPLETAASNPVVDGKAWKLALPAEIAKAFHCTKTPSIFPSSDISQARVQHPMPELHCAVRFCRNVICHLNNVQHSPAMLTAMKNQDAVRFMTSSPGDFFYSSPCIVWLLVGIWEQRNLRMKMINAKMKAEHQRHVEEMQTLLLKQTALSALTY